MKRFLSLILSAAILSSFSVSLAHSGGTDANGGHHNRSTGDYHYHHGYSAHYHPDGICPYKSDNNDDSVLRDVPYSETDKYPAYATVPSYTPTPTTSQSSQYYPSVSPDKEFSLMDTIDNIAAFCGFAFFVAPLLIGLLSGFMGKHKKR